MDKLETKIPPAAVFIIAAILMWLVSTYTPQVDISEPARWILASLMTLSGAVLGLLGIIAFRGEKTTLNPMEPEQAGSLVNSGVYRISRNPMYLALALVLVAFAVYLESLWSLSILLLFMTYMTRFQIFPEERAMIKLFGEEYIEYMGRVRRWI